MRNRGLSTNRTGVVWIGAENDSEKVSLVKVKVSSGDMSVSGGQMCHKVRH